MPTQRQPIGILQGRLTPSRGRGIQFFPYEEWQQEFKAAKDIGFDCIELLVKADGYEKNPVFSSDGIAQIQALKKEYGLGTPSVHGFYSTDASYPKIMETLIRNAHSVGARTILVSFFGDNALKGESDKEKAGAQLKQPLKTAAELGVSIAIEAEMKAPELKEFIQSLNAPSAGIYYDLGNMASMNVDIPDEIELLGALIKGVHIKDRGRNGGETVPLGKGGVDFEEAFGALARIGYNGPCIIQGARGKDTEDIALNAGYLDFVKRQLPA